MEWVQQQIARFPDLANKYSALQDLHDRKLWHQLTTELQGFLTDPENYRGETHVDLYENFLSKFEAKLNQVRLAQLLSVISKSLGDANAGIQFLERALANRTRMGVEASLCVELDIILFKLQLGLLDEAKNGLEAAKQMLNGVSSTESIVFSKFYKASAEYRKAAGPADAFYRDALMYVSYTPVETLSDEERFTLATDMSLAAITGDDVYNFGEVIATPILQYLRGTPNHWLQELIVAFNQGDIDAFNTIIDSQRDAYFNQPALATRHDFVKQKVVLLCLMNMVFERPAHERNIPFADISHRTKLPVDQVEWLIMRAMSLRLIEGTMDQVDEVLHVTWVQPRVLDTTQLQQLAHQLDEWTTKVTEARAFIEERTPELYA